jgi:hypothetical protein
MDYLPVQGSSVPCECIFSSSAETDTKKWNRIKPLLMEALQMLKFYHRKSLLNFTMGLVLEEDDLEEDDPKDLLVELLSSCWKHTQHSIDKILTSLSDCRDEVPEDDPNEVTKVDSESEHKDGEDNKDSEDSKDGEDNANGENGEDGEDSADGEDGSAP